MKGLYDRIVVGVTVVLVAPFCASAATVTVTPAAAAAPTMSASILALLALAMAVSAVYLLRRSRTLATTLAGILALSGSLAVAHRAWAVGTVTVKGEACGHRAEYEYPGGSGVTNLLSLCDNPIRIVAIAPCAEGGDTETAPGTPRTGSPSFCEVGQVLQEEDVCRLPLCDD